TLALLVDSLTNIPSLVNDALGHPRVTGKFALANGVVGVALVYIGTANWGIVGAAAGHLLSSTVMGCAFLLFVHGRTVPVAFAETLRQGFGRSIAVGAAAIGAVLPLKWMLPEHLLATLGVVTLAGLVLGIAGLFLIVGNDDRNAMLALARRLRS